MQNPTVTIRSGTTADAALIAEFGAQAFTAAFADDNSPEDMVAYLADAFSPAKQQVELADPASQFLIAEVAGAMAGYAHVKAGSTDEGVTGTHPIELVRIYTDPVRIGQGIGKALICLTQNQLGDKAKVILLAAPQAVNYYPKVGFAAHPSAWILPARQPLT